MKSSVKQKKYSKHRKYKEDLNSSFKTFLLITLISGMEQMKKLYLTLSMKLSINYKKTNKLISSKR